MEGELAVLDGIENPQHILTLLLRRRGADHVGIGESLPRQKVTETVGKLRLFSQHHSAKLSESLAPAAAAAIGGENPAGVRPPVRHHVPVGCGARRVARRAHQVIGSLGIIRHELKNLAVFSRHYEPGTRLRGALRHPSPISQKKDHRDGEPEENAEPVATPDRIQKGDAKEQMKIVKLLRIGTLGWEGQKEAMSSGVKPA